MLTDPSVERFIIGLIAGGFIGVIMKRFPQLGMLFLGKIFVVLLFIVLYSGIPGIEASFRQATLHVLLHRYVVLGVVAGILVTRIMKHPVELKPVS